MLVFGMREVDYVVIDQRIIVRMKWEGNDVKLCIDAPKDVSIERDKVYEKRCLMEGTKPKWEFYKLVKDKRKRKISPGHGPEKAST
jgi:sRNA-binding carbon storage regulator CsrA